MQLAIPLAGAWLGSFFGPLGAQIGWMIGSSLSSKTPGAKQNIGDLGVQTAGYNVPIPYPMGKMRLTGNVIWAADKKPYSIKSGGKNSTVVGTGYKFNLAIAICEGPILGISKVWADNELIIDSSVSSKPLIGTLYTGTTSQSPDPTMESYLGAGNVPAYHGIAYIVLNNFDTGTSTSIPNFSFEVVREI